MSAQVKQTAQLVISVDVEDWLQSTWDRSLDVTPRSAHNTERVLDILQSHGAKVTMFVLGKFAEKFPGVVKRIAQDGHEVAAHSYGHIEVFQQTPQQFRADTLRNKQLLEDITGTAVHGFRAPDFSIISESIWALDILAELEFSYDSSIVPVRMKRYGIDGWPNTPVRVVLPSGRSIVELPLATKCFPGLGVYPIGGGGYHRLLPWPLIKWAVSSFMQKQMPFMAYCHPYEFDPGELTEIPQRIPLKMRLHQGIGRGSFQAKFESLLALFPLEKASVVALGSQWDEYRLG